MLKVENLSVWFMRLDDLYLLVNLVEGEPDFLYANKKNHNIT